MVPPPIGSGPKYVVHHSADLSVAFYATHVAYGVVTLPWSDLTIDIFLDKASTSFQINKYRI